MTVARVDLREQKGRGTGTAEGMRATVWLGSSGQKEILRSKGGEESSLRFSADKILWCGFSPTDFTHRI